MSSKTRLASAPLLLALGLTACSAGQTPSTGPAPQQAEYSESDLRAIEEARADSARLPYTAADIHFMSGMIGHHSQAITMAGWVPTHDASPAIQRLAERIVNGQSDEIVTMQTWLKDRLQPVPEPDSGGMTMMHGHEMTMPGMLTHAQMQQLDQARGAEFDRLFLTFMIQHHKGALTMVKELFGSYGAGQDEIVFKFASDVNVDQITEIARMESMLDQMAPEGASR
ncbi:MAG TPA: DUF305 domain-containing protein [Gemmatimonadales bacterium]|nr:DUF305 domain-containing protein [Gemmatimonadales bacterium]